MLALLLMTTLAASAAGAPAPAAPAGEIVERLQARLDRMTTLKGRFVQTLDSKSLGRPRTEEGRFCLKKPAFMRWDYERPEEKLALLDGTHSWLYLPADHEVYRGLMKDVEHSSAPALLLSGRLRLDDDFVSRLLPASEAGPQGVAGAVPLELKPKKPSEEFERLVLALDARMQIRRLTVFDALGGRMVFDLFDLEEDTVLPDDLFYFTIPAGVDVIENR